MNPTDEQQLIIDAFKTDQDLVIEALAGTGKSTTLKMLGHDCYPDRQGTYIAFNRAVAQEARSGGFPANVDCRTGHSLAARATSSTYGHKMDGGRIMSKDLAEEFGITKWFRTAGTKVKDISSWRIAAMARQTIERYCRSDDEHVLAKHVPYVEGVANMDELRQTVLPYAVRLWAMMVDPSSPMPFSAMGGRGDDAYMKIWALGDPKLYGHFVMVDESQDTNGVLAGVLRKQDHLQRIFVGDSRQRLFDWRGSVDVMNEFSTGAEVLYLTQSFRFGEAVAEEANRWLGYLGEEITVRGLESIDSEVGPVDEPDAVLCRTNADVVDQALVAQEKGVRVGIVGGVDEIMSMSQAADQLRQDGKTSHRDLSIFKSWRDVVTYVDEEKPGGTFATMVKLIERYGTTKVQQIAGNCVPMGEAERVLATVHKVKGLEWGSVAIDGGVAPGKDEQDDPDGSQSDFMVAYVAVTRAKEELDTTAIEYFHRRREMQRRIVESRPAAAGK